MLTTKSKYPPQTSPFKILIVLVLYRYLSVGEGRVTVQGGHGAVEGHRSRGTCGPCGRCPTYTTHPHAMMCCFEARVYACRPYVTLRLLVFPKFKYKIKPKFSFLITNFTPKKSCIL